MREWRRDGRPAARSTANNRGESSMEPGEEVKDEKPEPPRPYHDLDSYYALFKPKSK